MPVYDDNGNVIPDGTKSPFLGGKVYDDSGNEKQPSRDLLGPHPYWGANTEKFLTTPLLGSNKEPEDYWGGFRRSLYKDYIEPLTTPRSLLQLAVTSGISADAASKLVNPDTVKVWDEAIGAIPKVNEGIPKPGINPVDSSTQARVAKLAGLDVANRPQLPAATNPEVAPARASRFISGPAGVAENKYYPVDTAAPTPRIGQREAGTILPRETEGLYQIPPDLAAREGLDVGQGKPEEAVPSPQELHDRPANEAAYPSAKTFNIEQPNQYPFTTPSAERPIPAKPPLDAVNAAPRVITEPESLGKVPAGQPDVPIPPGKDISAFRAEFSTPHVVADNFPQVKGVVDPIYKANDEGLKWLATTQREFADISSGLNTEDRQRLMYILNGDEIPDRPDLMAKAAKAKNLLDHVYDMASDNSPENIGFIDRYITHIEKQPDDFKSAVASIVDHQFGQKSGLYQIFSSGNLAKATGDIGDLYEKGIGSPTSNFIKKRTGALSDIETDYDKIIPTYLESMKKVIFDRPATDEAKDALKSLPVGKLKEWATAYIKNYTKYDADAELSKAWNSLANQIATTNARSVISFNPLVHAYHAGQLPANIWPELGTRYSMQGALQFLQHPIEGYQELAKNGLFSNMIRPMQFQTPMQKFDSASYYLNMVESLVKGTGYYGFKQRALDAGLDDAAATMRAIAETKNATATVDPARTMRYFTPESNILGGQMGRLAKQYHQIPTKLVEQFARAMADWKENPAMAARYVAGSTIAGAGSVAGLHTLHINPLTLAGSYAGGAGQFGTVMTSAIRDLGRGNLGAALGDIATWAAPGGAVAKKGIKFVQGE